MQRIFTISIQVTVKRNNYRKFKHSPIGNMNDENKMVTNSWKIIQTFQLKQYQMNKNRFDLKLLVLNIDILNAFLSIKVNNLYWFFY